MLIRSTLHDHKILHNSRPDDTGYDARASLADRMPLMTIRGEHSDLLSRETVGMMCARRPDMAVIEVPGQGHAPLLRDDTTLDPIVAFVARGEEKIGA